jgi:hypothetical protein
MASENYCATFRQVIDSKWWLGATMPRFFQSPAGALKQERIPFQDKLTQNDLITDNALMCPLYLQHAMMSKHGVNVSPKDMIPEAVVDWYEDRGQYMMDDYAYKSRSAKTPRKEKCKKPSNLIAFPSR